jgi:protein-L-isoaspartate(D-aspartate) O-methyltransferase
MAAVSTEKARFNMIEQQIRPWEVLDRRVLEIFEDVPREAFVAEAYRNLAFADIEIPIGLGEAMMAPKVEARMLQALAVQPKDQVLEIGTGSGFVTACLARLGAWVTSIEINPALTEAARARLASQQISNLELRTGDAFSHLGEPRYDVIAVTGSLPLADQSHELAQCLALGGRMFVVVGEAPVMEATLVTRIWEDQYTVESLFETELRALTNARTPQRFHF